MHFGDDKVLAGEHFRGETFVAHNRHFTNFAFFAGNEAVAKLSKLVAAPAIDFAPDVKCDAEAVAY